MCLDDFRQFIFNAYFSSSGLKTDERRIIHLDEVNPFSFLGRSIKRFATSTRITCLDV